MPTVIAYHEIDDRDHWLASPKRAELFGPLGIEHRTFVDPENPSRVAVIFRFRPGRPPGGRGIRSRCRGHGVRRCPGRHPGASRRGIARYSEQSHRFESAADAVVAGDVAALDRLLVAQPDLIRARSTRAHRATLLHYVGANGVEDDRQRAPPNAVEVADLLLAAGSEVDAVASMYGEDTTLELVATSIHPARAGVLVPLLETLLDAGASIDGVRGDSVVGGALANGRPQAAEFLAGRGARLDLEGAAGLGRIDLVERSFDEEGNLTGAATRTQLEAGFSGRASTAAPPSSSCSSSVAWTSARPSTG